MEQSLFQEWDCGMEPACRPDSYTIETILVVNEQQGENKTTSKEYDVCKRQSNGETANIKMPKLSYAQQIVDIVNKGKSQSASTIR